MNIVINVLTEEMPPFIRKERISIKRKAEFNKNGEYVLYIMEMSQRANQNFALETAIYYANLLKKPLIVYFNLNSFSKRLNLRHYVFMLEGIIKLKKVLTQRGIKIIIRNSEFFEKDVKLVNRAVLVIVDRGYLKYQKIWRQNLARIINIPMIEIEGDVICPIETVSNKKESNARTLRPKIMKLLPYFLEIVPQLDLKVCSHNIEISSWEEENIYKYLEKLSIDKSVFPVEYFKGGEDEALKRLEIFIKEKLHLYAKYRVDPGFNVTSELSPYLRFGQISPIQILLKILKETPLEDENVKSFFNELVVWRELARNYVWYNSLYDQYEGLPLWARKTLEDHINDPREYLYEIFQFEKGETDDPYWNAAQKELLKKGKIHNYIRMYWCKKLIEWTKNPKKAFEIACYLNNKYALDGEDPNSYSGISWCFGTFDHPFLERPIYGKIRKMTKTSLTSKLYFKEYLKNTS